jgi:hypothetical protein
MLARGSRFARSAAHWVHRVRRVRACFHARHARSLTFLTQAPVLSSFVRRLFRAPTLLLRPARLSAPGLSARVPSLFATSPGRVHVNRASQAPLAPSSGYLSLTTVYSSPGLRGLLHPRAACRDAVQGLLPPRSAPPSSGEAASLPFSPPVARTSAEQRPHEPPPGNPPSTPKASASRLRSTRRSVLGAGSV